MTTYITYTVQLDGTTLSALVWGALKRQPIGFVEKVIEHNRELFRNGVFLTKGDVVRIPISELEESQQSSNVIRIWD